MVRCESRPSTIGHITLDTKQTGAPSAGNPRAGCEVAGAGNGFTVWLLRHSQRKRGETARPDLRNTAPVPDPTAGVMKSVRCVPSLRMTCRSGFVQVGKHLLICRRGSWVGREEEPEREPREGSSLSRPVRRI